MSVWIVVVLILSVGGFVEVYRKGNALATLYKILIIIMNSRKHKNLRHSIIALCSYFTGGVFYTMAGSGTPSWTTKEYVNDNNNYYVHFT